jgi:predicted nucleotidyltransferase
MCRLQLLKYREGFMEETAQVGNGGGFIVTAKLLKNKAGEIRRLARTHGVVRMRVFGSRASDLARGASDLDLLVALRPDRELLDLVEFKLDLEDLLGCEVDVVTESGLSPYLRREIIRTAKPLLPEHDSRRS